MLYTFFKYASFLLFKILFGFRRRGTENFPKSGGVILASNHLSFMDPVVLGAGAPRPLHFLARQDLFEINRFFGWLISSVNAHPLKRAGFDRRSLKEAVDRLKTGNVLVIFPEGTRSKDGTLGRGRPGLGLLVSMSGVPVIPAFIKGTNKVMPPDSKFIHISRVSVTFGKMMVFSAGAGDNPEDRPSYPLEEGSKRSKECYQDISDQVMREIASLGDCPRFTERSS